MNKFNLKAFGLATGILWSGYLLVLGLLATQFNVGVKFVDLFATFYWGYKPTILGSFIGALWGLGDGTVGGIIFAWLYNKLAR